jgi:hypothetical protein
LSKIKREGVGGGEWGREKSGRRRTWDCFMPTRFSDLVFDLFRLQPPYNCTANLILGDSGVDAYLYCDGESCLGLVAKAVEALRVSKNEVRINLPSYPEEYEVCAWLRGERKCVKLKPDYYTYAFRRLVNYALAVVLYRLGYVKSLAPIAAFHGLLLNTRNFDSRAISERFPRDGVTYLDLFARKYRHLIYGPHLLLWSVDEKTL